MSWVDALAGAKHKAVFDATLISNGLALGHVDLYMRGYHDVYDLDERELRPVLVIRHEAVPMFLNDAFWQKYQLGQKLRLTDPSTGTVAARNPFAAPGAKPVEDWTTIQQLHARGVTVLGCDKALRSVAALMAQQSGQTAESVTAEARAAVVPNVILMPSGIFAVLRAQEAGCAYIRST
jgi:intracellular sulfur oxidation DsrE/DsrF family protein